MARAQAGEASPLRKLRKASQGPQTLPSREHIKVYPTRSDQRMRVESLHILNMSDSTTLSAQVDKLNIGDASVGTLTFSSSQGGKGDGIAIAGADWTIESRHSTIGACRRGRRPTESVELEVQ